jgi:D-glycero-alpha-D-manno-heptose 1-phosphate guanylyltransferase
MTGTKAVLLVGGLGTRLRSVLPSTPKPLASIGDRPFLELLVRQLRHQGVRHLVMCTGHLADQVEEVFGTGRSLDVEIRYSKELTPLGTAGALRLAQEHLQGAADFFVMNGDSFLEVDLHSLLCFHRDHRGLATITTLQVPNASRYGTVQVNPDGRVTSFAEKTDTKAPGLVNAGVYVFSSNILNHIPEGPSSLERDIFPRLLDHGVYGLEQQGVFIDIGTPEDYARAQTIRDHLRDATLTSSYGADHVRG